MFFSLRSRWFLGLYYVVVLVGLVVRLVLDLVDIRSLRATRRVVREVLRENSRERVRLQLSCSVIAKGGKRRTRKTIGLGTKLRLRRGAKGAVSCSYRRGLISYSYYSRSYTLFLSSRGIDSLIYSLPLVFGLYYYY